MPIPGLPRAPLGILAGLLGVLAVLLCAAVVTTVATTDPSSTRTPSSTLALGPTATLGAGPSLDPGPELSLTGTGDITVTGSIDRSPGRSYSFGLAAGLTITVSVTSAAGDARVTVIDPDGRTRATEEVSATFDKVAAGTWLFRVTSRSDTARYTLHITAA